MNPEKRAGYLMLLPSLAVMAGIAFFPILWVLWLSLHRKMPIFHISRFVGLENYRFLAGDDRFWRSLANTLYLTAMSVGLELLLGLAIARTEIRGKVLVLGAVLSLSMFPPIAIVSPLYLLIRALHLRDSWWALILTHTAFTLPLSIWILANFFREIPEEILKAARVDGCSTFQVFSRIILPLAAPGLFTAAILVFIFSWNEFLFALTFTATEASRTVPVGIALFPGVHEIPWGEIAAASIVVTLPLVGMVFAFQKRIVQGLTAGAVKG